MTIPTPSIPASNIQQMVDRFHVLGLQIGAARMEREHLRIQLIQAATATGKQQFQGASAQVQINRLETVKLPEIGSKNRIFLEAAISAAGQWTAVSQLAAPKLKAALDRDLFTPKQRDQITTHLPPGGSLRLTSRRLKK